MDGDLIHQMGLLLTQLRYARRSLEDIERSTARYTTFTFAGALAAGPRWGEPPMYGGALKVWVVNINDLAPSGAGLFETFLGGMGRLFGGLLGGLIGGTIAGVALPVMVDQLNSIANTVERIVARIAPLKQEPTDAVAKAADKAQEKDKKDKDKPELVTAGPSVLEQVAAFTALFEAAAGDPKKAAATADPTTPEATRWIGILNTAKAIIDGINTLVQGLILLLPIVIGSIALLFARLDNIKLAIVELLQFLLQEALLLRGVVLVVVLDTLAAVARLAANILGILGETLASVTTAVFNIFYAVFDAALAAIQFLSGGLAKTIDALLNWLLGTLVTALTTIGDTRIFRVAVYAIQTLPYILPSLVMLVTGNEIGKKDSDRLDSAKLISVLPPTFPGTPPITLPPFPSVSATLLDPAAIGVMRGSIDHGLSAIKDNLGTIFDDSKAGLLQMNNRLERAAGDQAFGQKIGDHAEQLRKDSLKLAGTLNPVAETLQDKIAKHEPTGLDIIAKAYEDWLSSKDGLGKLLGNITDYLNKTPTQGPAAATSLIAKSAGPSVLDRPRATVEIDDVVIELMPPAETDLPHGVPGVMKALSDHSPAEFMQAIAELMHELDQRGAAMGPGSLVHQW
jgi:hypothetical protein